MLVVSCRSLLETLHATSAFELATGAAQIGGEVLKNWLILVQHHSQAKGYLEVSSDIPSVPLYKKFQGFENPASNTHFYPA